MKKRCLLFHEWTHNTQGAEYCMRCRKFRRWLPGTIRRGTDPVMGNYVAGWGYLLNGPEWTQRENDRIMANGGKYD